MRFSNFLKRLLSVFDSIANFEFTPFIAFFLLAIVVFTWFDGNSFISGGDFTWPLTFGGFYDAASHVWDSSASTGYNNPRQLISLPTFALPGLLFEKLNINSASFERFYFFLNFFAAGCGIFLLLKAYDFNRLASFFGALIYLFNPYTLSVTWVTKAGNHIAFYCFLPLAIYTAVLFLRTKQVKFLFFHLVIIFFAMSTFVNPVFIAPYTIILLAVLLCEHLFFSHLSITHLMILALSTIAILSYWLVPFAISFNENFVSASNAKLNDLSDTDLLKLNAVKIVDAFRADGNWAIQAGENGENYYQWHALFLNPIYILVSFSLVFLAFSPLLINFKKKKLFLFWVIFFIMAILLNNAYKDDAMLLKKVNQLLFGTDIIARAFRNVYAKLGVLLIIPITFMIASFVDVLERQKNGKYILLVAPILLYIFILSSPFITGTIIKDSGDYLPGDKFTLPPDYYTFLYYDSYQSGNFRYLEYPLPITYNYRFTWNESNKYNGASFLKFLTNKPVIFVNFNEVISAAPCISDRQTFYRILSVLTVNKVLVHNDIEARTPANYICYSNRQSIDEYMLDLTSRQYEHFSVYSIPSDYQLPRIYSSNATIIPNNSFETLQDVLSSSDYSLRSVVYLNVSKASKNYDLLSSLPNQYTTEKLNQSNIYIPNPSFEDGLWTVTPEDCSDGWPGRPLFNMSLSDDASDGAHSLELYSRNHNACTYTRFLINSSKGKPYVYSFDFKTLEGNNMRYGVIFSNTTNVYSYSDFEEIDSSNWTHYEKILTPPKNVTNVQLSFYAPSENNNPVKTLFDNVKLSYADFFIKNSSNYISDVPITEFKEISPSKYRVRIHHASANFPLIFSESFHEGWKAYSVEPWQSESNLNLLADYKILEGNQNEQGTVDEIRRFIQNGDISTLGNGYEKTKEHKLLEKDFTAVDYFEKFKVNFISKNVQGSIQNDNLPDGSIFETWFDAPITEDNHVLANGYSNSWIIEPRKICAEINKCKVNSDGSYDFELVIEYWPERLFQIGLVFSILTLFVCFTVSIYEWRITKGNQ